MKKLTYLDMIILSIGFLRARGGCSRQLLHKFVQEHFKKYTVCFDRAFRRALIVGNQRGFLIQNKQKFKLSQYGKNKLKSMESLIQK